MTEAVLRRLTNDHSKEAMHEIAESGVRGEEGIKEFSVDYQGTEIKICVASGLANARKVMDQVKSGEKEYHLIEIMACRRGCITTQTIQRSSKNLMRTHWFRNCMPDY